jgi:hypothetical protein
MKLEASKLLIVGIFAFALCAAGFAVWFRSQQGRRALELWGAEPSHRIRNAPQVELRYYPPQVAAPNDDAPDAEPEIRQTDISQVADLIHIRRVFLDDIHILWDAPAVEDCEPRWEYALVFRDTQGETTVWLDSACYHVRLGETGPVAKFTPPVLRSVLRFCDRRLGREPRAAPSDTVDGKTNPQRE